MLRGEELYTKKSCIIDLGFPGSCGGWKRRYHWMCTFPLKSIFSSHHLWKTPPQPGNPNHIYNGGIATGKLPSHPHLQAFSHRKDICLFLVLCFSYVCVTLLWFSPPNSRCRCMQTSCYWYSFKRSTTLLRGASSSAELQQWYFLIIAASLNSCNFLTFLTFLTFLILCDTERVLSLGKSWFLH